jgi:leucyl aminopeptidase
MRSLKVRFALLLGATALLVILAALGVLAAIGAAERAIDRTLAAQGRLELLVELSGRMTQYGLAALEAVSNADAQPEGLALARTAVDKALTAVDESLGRTIAASDDPLDRTLYAARTRPMAQLRSARVVLDRQVTQVLRKSEDEQRKAAIRGALNGFGAMTGQPLSFLIEVERRSMIAGSDEARALSGQLRIGAFAAALFALGVVLVLYRGVTKPTLARIEAIRRAAGAIGRRLSDRAVIGSVLHTDLGDADGATSASVEGFLLGSYKFTAYKSDPRPSKIQEILLPDAGADAVERGVAVAEATALARDLINEPASTLTPDALAARAREVADVGGLTCTVMDETELADKGFGGMLAVAQGSTTPPRLIQLHYKPDGASRKVILVGKGITFDSGGLSLKDPKNMETMKTDMSGGAAVIGTMSALGRLKPNVEVVAIVPASENMPGGEAMKPGDVMRHYGGKTTEVLNTDAEGRLVLADALAYASEMGADAIVDVATLTGSITVALGLKIAGLFSNDDDLAAEILAAGDVAGERYWRMPLFDDFKPELISEVADQRNVGSRWGGSIIAAKFLEEFVADGVRWAHLDIAGPARAEADYDDTPKGGAGFATRTLISWVESVAR